MAVAASGEGVSHPGAGFRVVTAVGGAAVGVGEIATHPRGDAIGCQRQICSPEVEVIVLVQGTARPGIGRMTGAAPRSQR